jgi:hypothetical protein
MTGAVRTVLGAVDGRAGAVVQSAPSCRVEVGGVGHVEPGRASDAGHPVYSAVRSTFAMPLGCRRKLSKDRALPRRTQRIHAT